jgi:hypothetical protein
MNATPKTNTLAAAFAAAALSAPQRPASAHTSTPVPSPRLEPSRPTALTQDELLVAVLRHSLTRADQFIARRTLLRAAPWEDALM